MLAQRTMSKPPPATMTFGVSQLWFTPPQPVAGQTVTVHMRVDTAGTGTHVLPWRIYAGSLLLAQGENPVDAGHSFEKSATWAPPAGAHMISARLDPSNLLIEPASARANNIFNVMMTVNAPPNWPVWGAAAWAGTQQAIRAWLPAASLSGVKIAGPLALGGKVIGPSLKTTIKTAMTSANAPEATADKFAQAVADAWQTWHEGLSVPSLPLYPSFLVVPGSHAPPTPSVATPLATLSSSRASAISPQEIRSRLVGQLGASAGETGAGRRDRHLRQHADSPAGHLVADRLGRQRDGIGPGARLQAALGDDGAGGRRKSSVPVPVCFPDRRSEVRRALGDS